MKIRELQIPEQYRKPLINFAAFLIPLVYYGFFMSKGPGYIDSAYLLATAYRLDLSPWVNHHNLFSLIVHILIKIFSGADEFIVANTFSMICGAGTVFFAFLLTSEISGNKLIACVVSVALMFSHSLTWHSTMLEVYTLNSVLLISMIYCFCRYFRDRKTINAWIGVMLWGLGISNHYMMLLFAVPVIWFLIAEWKNLGWKRVLAGAGFFLLGLSLFLVIFIRAWIDCGSLSELFNRYSGKQYQAMMFSSDGYWFWTLNYLIFFLYQFSLAALFAGIKGFRQLFRKDNFSIFFLLAFFVQFIWSMNYHIWDSFAFALPVYVMFSVPLAYGLKSFRNWKLRYIMLSLVFVLSFGQIILYANISKIKPMQKYAADYPLVSMVKDAYDPLEFFLNPWKRNFSVSDYLDSFMDAMPQNAYVFDNVYEFPFVYYYQIIKKERQDIYWPNISSFREDENDMKYWSSAINNGIQKRGEVYLSGYIYRILKERLNYKEADKVYITEDEFLYRLTGG